MFNRKQRRTMKSIGLPTKGNAAENVESIQKEYANACTVAGQLQYQIVIKQEELGALNKRIKKLNEAFNEVSASNRAAASSTVGGDRSPSSPPPASEVK